MSKQVSVYEFHADRLLLAGKYDTWDEWDMWSEDALGMLPPIGYVEGEAL